MTGGAALWHQEVQPELSSRRERENAINASGRTLGVFVRDAMMGLPTLMAPFYGDGPLDPPPVTWATRQDHFTRGEAVRGPLPAIAAQAYGSFGAVVSPSHFVGRRLARRFRPLHTLPDWLGRVGAVCTPGVTG